MKILLILILSLVIEASYASQINYPTGMMRLYRGGGERNGYLDYDRASNRFIQEQFGQLPDVYQWRVVKEQSDETHRHSRYQLYYQSTPVADQFLDLHYNKRGFVDFATSGWKTPFLFEKPNRAEKTKAEILKLYRERYRHPGRAFAGEITAEPIIWKEKEGAGARRAYEVKVVTKAPIRLAHLYVDAVSGEVLENKRLVRYVNESRKVYPVDPDNTPLLTPRELLDTEGNTTLKDTTNNVCWIRRLEDTTTPVLVDVDPRNAGYDAVPSGHEGGDYNYTCDSDEVTTGCPNQGLDAINVYYHIKQFRNRLQGYYSSIGYSPNFSLDPIQVTINEFQYDFDNTGDVSIPTDDANNALFVGAQLGFTGGIFFLRPGQLGAGAACVATTELEDLAREAVVIVHEYQHYVTDEMAGLVGGTLEDPDLADALHEGYSDYMATSHVSDAEGGGYTLIGDFSFDNCPAYQRELSSKVVFQNDGSFDGIYETGLVWASGLWDLRNFPPALGNTVVDKLAIQSLLFLSAQPGFLEAVEALVQADLVQNGGANAERIRNLFYVDLNFMGSLSTDIFRDLSTGIVEMGFRSCATVPFRGASGSLSLLMMALWLTITVSWGRWKWRR